MSGRVYLIGAGPGEPGLLTLRGAELLSRADVVMYDALSNDALLCHAPQAEQICVGKHGQSRIWLQSEICDELVRQARLGRNVVRLKGGDPAIFARTAEEIEALRAAEIPFEVVPGITAALAAGSYAGIPITHRGLASAVALVTGHEEPEKSESALDWSALAQFPGTLVIYMGVTTAPQWTAALLAAGKPPDTPTAIIRRCSHADQHTVHCRLDQVSDQLTPAHRLRPPVIVIIGAVTALAPTMSWFDQRPLFGQTVLVTRPADQAEELAEPLRELGAQVVYQPLLEITCLDDFSELDRCIHTLSDSTSRPDTLVFTSTNGVDYFLQRLFALGYDVRHLARIELAAVGSKTRQAIERYHLRCDIVPEQFDADALAAHLIPTAAGRRFLWVRAGRGRQLLADALVAAGATVNQVIAYQHQDITIPNPKIVDLLCEGRIDWATVTSSQSAANLVQLFGNQLHQARIATLSPLTSEAMGRLGFEVSAEACPYTMQALAAAIAAARTSLSETGS